MEYFDNILCVTYKELLDIMPKGTLNSQLSREKLDVVSRGGGENNPALYAYSSLPEKYKKRWVERHGEPEKQMRQEMIRNKTRRPRTFSRITVTTRTVRWSLFPRM